MIQKVHFKQFTDKSITDFETFQESLNEVRRKGYAVSYEEHTSDVFGVAAPIFDLNGDIKMVIAYIGFASKISEEHISFCRDKLNEASKRIMEVIGGREGTDTLAGDKSESLGVKQVFGKLTSQIPISSIKGAVGHTLGASSK